MSCHLLRIFSPQRKKVTGELDKSHNIPYGALWEFIDRTALNAILNSALSLRILTMNTVLFLTKTIALSHGDHLLCLESIRNDFAVALREHDKYTCVLSIVTTQNSRCQNEFCVMFLC